MNKKTIIIVIITVIITLIISVGVTLAIVLPKNNNTTNKTEINNSKTPNKKEEQSKEKEEITENIAEEKLQNEEIHKEENLNNSSSEIKSETNKTEENIKAVTEPTPTTETDIVKYFEDISTSDSEGNLKKGFVNLVDFLFYNKDINGITFLELTSEAKLKVIKIALKLDAKIEEYFPGYKETISSTTNKIYTDIKSKLIALYLDTTVKVCSNNSQVCEDAKNGLSELKKNFNISWDFIKDISGVGLTKLKDWYEVWREK